MQYDYLAISHWDNHGRTLGPEITENEAAADMKMGQGSGTKAYYLESVFTEKENRD